MQCAAAAHGVDAAEVVWLVQWGQGIELAQLRQHLVIDQHGFTIVGTAVGDAVTNAQHGSEVALRLQPLHQVAQRLGMVVGLDVLLDDTGFKARLGADVFNLPLIVQ